MHDDLLVLFGAFFRRLTRDQCRPFEHWREPVVGARDVAFRKNHQRALGALQDLDRRLHRLLVHPLAINRKRAGATQYKRLHLAAHEQMCTGHDEEWPAHLPCQRAQDKRIFIPAMIWRDQNTMARFDR